MQYTTINLGICNLARLNAARTPLPLPPPLDQMWLKTTKIIDVFHLRNHISEECKHQFSPLSVKQQYPDMNTQVGEQTFTWLYHFKHILCAMPKVHHLFYLHRMVVRRNKYTGKYYRRSQYYQKKSRNSIVNLLML